MSRQINLHENEEVIKYVTQHWLVPFKIISVFAVFVTFALGIMLIGNELLYLYPNFAKVPIIVGYITLLFSVHWFFILIFKWLNSRCYITTLRVIHFSVLPFVADDITYILIEEIHEIEEHKHGLISNIFNYGTVTVNLPAMPNAIELTYMPKPQGLVDLVESIRRGEIVADEEDLLSTVRSKIAEELKFVAALA